ncbi:hypothetical protein RRG08_053571 [Elysia crispata]|uniref:Uncharacterized protein n=1 Tax=Elysia crispata TaxID=231223 RepID=A0AAE0Y1P6_9GAST|nr:hypothetical protein RRG08_053571 [Elysia crispata]
MPLISLIIYSLAARNFGSSGIESKGTLDQPACASLLVLTALCWSSCSPLYPVLPSLTGIPHLTYSHSVLLSFTKPWVSTRLGSSRTTALWKTTLLLPDVLCSLNHLSSNSSRPETEAQSCVHQANATSCPLLSVLLLLDRASAPAPLIQH